MPLNRYARQNIFQPLGMRNTGGFLRDIDRNRYTTHYVSHNGHITPIPAFENTTYPNGGVRTSINDLSKFFIALLKSGSLRNVRLLQETSANEMLRFQFTDASRPKNYPAADGNSGLSKQVGIIVLSNTSLSGEEQIALIRRA